MLNFIFEQVTLRLKQIDLKTLWPGFKPYSYALYTGQSVLYTQTPNFHHNMASQVQHISYDHRFIGNTAIDFEGNFMAIWNVEDLVHHDTVLPTELDKVASGIVHEMFHAHQRTLGETRFPSDLELLLWSPTPDELSKKSTLMMALVGAYHALSTGAPPFIYEPLCAQYIELRMQKNGQNAQESALECIEGTAEYIGLKALKILNPQAYTQQFNNHIKTCLSAKALVSLRTSAYATGTLFFALVDCLGLTTHLKPISATETTSYFDQIPWNQVSWFERNRLESRVAAAHDLLEDQRGQLNQFLATATCELFEKDEQIIVGYDPINMFRYGDTLMCNHFIMLNSFSPQFIKGPLALHMKAGSPNIVVGMSR